MIFHPDYIIHADTGVAYPHMGSWDSSVVRASDSWLKGHGFESLQEQQENFLLQGPLSVLTHFGIRSTPVLPQSHVKDSGHSAKVRVAGYS